MIVLGIDPGSRITGVGVIESRGQELRWLHHEMIRTGNGEIGERLAAIYHGIGEVCGRFSIDTCAVEKVFMANNARSALVLGHARGSAICALVNAGLTVNEYSAREIKSAVVGTGAAEKPQVQHMVRVLLGMRETPPADAADALACAICHVHTSVFRRRAGLLNSAG